MWKFLISSQPTINIHIDRIPISNVPHFTSQYHTLQWLHQRYQLKDEIISKHYGINVDTNHVDTTDARISVPQLLPNLSCAVLWVGSTAYLLSNDRGRQVYLTSLMGGSLLGMLYAKLFLWRFNVQFYCVTFFRCRVMFLPLFCVVICLCTQSHLPPLLIFLHLRVIAFCMLCSCINLNIVDL